MLRERVVEAQPPCAHVSTKADAALPVLGMLSQPLRVAVKTVSNDVQCRDEERYQVWACVERQSRARS